MIDPDRKQLDIVPVLQFLRTPSQEWSYLRKVITKSNQTSRFDLVEAVLRDDVGALPVIAAIQGNENPASLHAAQRLVRVVGLAREPHPQHIDRSAPIDYFKPRFRTHN